MIQISECPSINYVHSIQFLRCIILVNYNQQDFFDKITFAKPVKKFVALYEMYILCLILYLFSFFPFSCLA